MAETQSVRREPSWLLTAAAVFAVGGIAVLAIYRDASYLVISAMFVLLWGATKLVARVIN